MADTTVQEKNITHPADIKLTHKIIRRQALREMKTIAGRLIRELDAQAGNSHNHCDE